MSLGSSAVKLCGTPCLAVAMAAWSTGARPSPIFAPTTPQPVPTELKVPTELCPDSPDSRRPASVTGPDDAPGDAPGGAPGGAPEGSPAVALAGRVEAYERLDDARDALSLPACKHLGSRLVCSSVYHLRPLLHMRAVEERGKPEYTH